MDIEVYNSIGEIDKRRWSQFISKRFFLSYKYLSAMEKACSQIKFRYVILKNAEDEISAVAYFQVIPFKGENLYNYIPESNPVLERIIRIGLSWIDTNLLVLGNAIFTCENGLAIDKKQVGPTSAWLLKVVEKARDSIPSNVMGIMLSESLTEKTNRFFCNHGFHSFRVEDRMELDAGSFASFEDYSKKLQSKYRVRMNKILTLNKEIEKIQITVDNFEIYRESIQRLFDEVLNKSKFKLTNISAEYYYQFLKEIDRFKMIGYVYEGELIAFMSYYDLDSIIEVHYIGMNYQYNEKYKIYNYMLYEILRTGIESQKKKICYGRTAQELKSTLGALPERVYSSLKVNNMILNLFTPFVLSKLKPSIWQIRSPFK